MSQAGMQGSGPVMEGEAAENQRMLQARMAAKLMLNSNDEWEGRVGWVTNAKTKTAKERYLILANGSLQIYEAQGLSKPLKQYLLRDVKAIRWTGIEVSTPLETFKLHETMTTVGQDPGITNKLFKALKEYTDARKEEPNLVKEYREGEG
eukprot:COSAG05_NODE_10073_length_584_cov_1.156701_1_plen_149_part_01